MTASDRQEIVDDLCQYIEACNKITEWHEIKTRIGYADGRERKTICHCLTAEADRSY